MDRQLTNGLHESGLLRILSIIRGVVTVSELESIGVHGVVVDGLSEGRRPEGLRPAGQEGRARTQSETAMCDFEEEL